MNALTIETVILSVCVSALSALIAILLDRKYYQQRKYEEWSAKNDQKIVDLELKAAEVQLRLNTVYEQLLALGIKLPRVTP